MTTDYRPESLSTGTPRSLEAEIELNGERVTNLPEVTLNGQRVVMAPEVREIYELINMANIAKMRKLEESKVAAGAQNIQLDASTNVQSASFPYPVLSLSIVNRGPGNFYYRINNGDPQRSDPPMLLNEVVNIDFQYPTIYTIHYRSDTTAIVTILVKTGKKWLEKVK